MDGGQAFVGAAGVGLVLTDYWLGSARSAISGSIFGSGNTVQAHGDLKVLGGELLFVVIATVLAGISTSWASVMAVVIVALWILWTIHWSTTKGATA